MVPKHSKTHENDTNRTCQYNRFLPHNRTIFKRSKTTPTASTSTTIAPSGQELVKLEAGLSTKKKAPTYY
ncbi:hypothetical protein [Lewinella sp. 4G2]|uniref:hypothetical protein n=1 Tax=Lewinella sp. 4G2 TaxID=1803372 RepID=UPI0007B467DC|nr:hypothetical protein [Lewinella sp. 4G2]OAV43417.1 hypothetical protein A3850_002400 [Lewinella sp. 4G2]